MNKVTVPMGFKIGIALKGLMEYRECGIYVECAPLGGKKEREVLGMSLRKNIMVWMDRIDTKKVYIYQLLWSY
jgi:hypothetical protein